MPPVTRSSVFDIFIIYNPRQDDTRKHELGYIKHELAGFFVCFFPLGIRDARAFSLLIHPLNGTIK